MVKDINRYEIEGLMNRLKCMIWLKKFINSNSEEFNKEFIKFYTYNMSDISLEQAIDIYKIKYLEVDISFIFLEYLRLFKIIDIRKYCEIDDISFNYDRPYDDGDEALIQKIEAWYSWNTSSNKLHSLGRILCEIAKNLNLDSNFALGSDFFTGDIQEQEYYSLKEFDFLENAFKKHFKFEGSMSEDEIIELFEMDWENYLLLKISNLKVNEEDLHLTGIKFSQSWNNPIKEHIFVKENDTFIIIDDCELLNINTILQIIIIFINHRR